MKIPIRILQNTNTHTQKPQSQKLYWEEYHIQNQQYWFTESLSGEIIDDGQSGYHFSRISGVNLPGAKQTCLRQHISVELMFSINGTELSRTRQPSRAICYYGVVRSKLLINSGLLTNLFWLLRQLYPADAILWEDVFWVPYIYTL